MLRLDSSLKSSHSKLHLFFLQFFLNGLLIMAIHLVRKLLPYLTSTSNYTNTPPCTDYCDPICGDINECYTFPDVPDSLPPLPPPLPPTTTIVATPSTSNDGFHLPPLVIVVIIVLASLFLLVSYYAIVIKYCSFWTRLVTRRDLSRMSRSEQPADPHLIEDHPDMVVNRFDPVVDHPIWLISTVGLHQSVINSITVIRYKKEDGLIDGTDCSVCLSEFQEGETLRLLPKCNHAFHIDCIDTWLRSHTNCPLCRASIVVNTGVGSNEPSFGHSRRTDLTLMVDSDTSDVELGSTHTGITNNVSSLLVENRGETGSHDVDQDQNKVEIDLNSSISILIRRSYSMDYRNVNAPYSQQNSSSNSNSNSNSNTSSFPFVGSSSRPQPPPRVRSMKRSYSWSDRVFGSARNQNDRNSDISP